jgi:ribosome-associated translation inhibitor RaiA
MDAQIIFSYVGCTKEDFVNEVSYNEEQFSEKLATLYQLNIQIDRIEVTIHHSKGEAETPFAVTVDVVAPTVNENKVTEHGKDLAGTTRKAIDTTIQLFRKHKDKHSSH